VNVPLGWGTSQSKFATNLPSYHLVLLFLFANFKKITIIISCMLSQFSWNFDSYKIILLYTCSTIFVEIEWRTKELCVIFKITSAICCHVYRVNHLMEWLENSSEHLIMQTFCGLKKIEIMVMELWQKHWPCVIHV